MKLMKTCQKCGTEYDTIKILCPDCMAAPRLTTRTKGRRPATTCNADHCTPEERAVIEAAVADRMACTGNVFAEPNEQLDKMVAARNALNNAVTALLAARAQGEKR